MKKLKYVVLFFAVFFMFSGNVNAASKTIQDGVYTISSAVNNKSVLDVSGKKMQNKTNIQLYADNYASNQQWKVTYLSNGYYKITSVANSNYALDVTGNKKKNGTNVQLYKYNKSTAQQWMIKDAGNGYYYIVSRGTGLYLDVKGGKTANKTNIQVWKGNKKAQQKFIFSPVVKGTKTLSNGDYVISSVTNSNYVLDLSGAKNQNNTNIQLYKYNGSTAQQWNVTYLNNGYYKITSLVDKNYSLDVQGAYKNRGTNLQLYKSNNTIAQQWVIKDLGNGKYNIISKASGLALDIKSGKIANNTNIQLYTNSSTNKNQQFKFEKVKTLETPEISYEVSDEYKIEVNTKDTYGTDYTGIELYRSDTENGKYNLVDTITKDESEVAEFDFDLKMGEGYYYKVRTYTVVKGYKLYSNYSNKEYIYNEFLNLEISSELIEDNIIMGENTYKIYVNGIYSFEDEYAYFLYPECDGIELYASEEDGDYELIGDYEYTDSIVISINSDIDTKTYYKVRVYNEINGVKKYSDYSNIIDIRDSDVEISIDFDMEYVYSEDEDAIYDGYSTYKVTPVEDCTDGYTGMEIYTGYDMDEMSLYASYDELEGNVEINDETITYVKIRLFYYDNDDKIYSAFSFGWRIDNREVNFDCDEFTNDIENNTVNAKFSITGAIDKITETTYDKVNIYIAPVIKTEDGWIGNDTDSNENWSLYQSISREDFDFDKIVVSLDKYDIYDIKIEFVSSYEEDGDYVTYRVNQWAFNYVDSDNLDE